MVGVSTAMNWKVPKNFAPRWANLREVGPFWYITSFKAWIKTCPRPFYVLLSYLIFFRKKLCDVYCIGIKGEIGPFWYHLLLNDEFKRRSYRMFLVFWYNLFLKYNNQRVFWDWAEFCTKIYFCFLGEDIMSFWYQVSEKKKKIFTKNFFSEALVCFCKVDSWSTA